MDTGGQKYRFGGGHREAKGFMENSDVKSSRSDRVGSGLVEKRLGTVNGDFTREVTGRTQGGWVRGTTSVRRAPKVDRRVSTPLLSGPPSGTSPSTVSDPESEGTG